MRKLIFLLLFCGCNIPYVKLNDNIFIKQFSWRSGIYFYVETLIKNIGAEKINVIIDCEIGGDNLEREIEVDKEVIVIDKIMEPPIGNFYMDCKYYLKGK